MGNETPSASSIEVAVAESTNRWSVALQQLSSEDQERYKVTLEPGAEPSAILQDVLAATYARKKECLEKRWKLVIGDRTIIIRDVLEKIATWVEKLMDIGTIAVSYDPVAAALPWAAVKLILQATVNDVEAYCYVLESLMIISNIIARCRIIEVLYLVDTHDCSTELAKEVLDMYTKILSYLCRVLKYYTTKTVVRVIKSTAASKADLAEHVQQIENAENQLFKHSQLAEASKTDSLAQQVKKVEDMFDKGHNESLEAIQGLQKIFEALCSPIPRLDGRLATIQDNLESEVRSKILKSISTITYATHHRVAREGRLPGSGKWLLNKEDYACWRKSSESSVLWLHGIPGCGKTKLTSLVIDDVRTTCHLAHFYCTRNPAEPLRSNPRAILASIVRQLATIGPKKGIFPAVVQQYQEAIDGFEEYDDQAWTISDCKRIILALLKEYPAVTIVIDALDEVQDEDRQDLIESLAELLKSAETLLKIFVSSRDNLDIVLSLSGSPNVYIEADDNYQDIKTFTHERLAAAKLLRGKLSSDLRDEIVETLLSGARGMFRWVELQIDSLKTLKVAADVRLRLGDLPETLEASYWEIYEKIMDSGEFAAKIAIFTFRWLLYAKEVLKTEAFTFITSAALRSAGLDPNEALGKSEVLDVCANLVVIRDNVFVFAHLSVREFLERLGRRGVTTMDADTSNAIIAETCITHFQMVFDIFMEEKNIDNDEALTNVLGHIKSEFHEMSRTIKGADTESPVFQGDEAGKGTLKKASKGAKINEASFSYVSRYWVHHVAEAGECRTSNTLAPLIKDFCVHTSEHRVGNSFILWCGVLNEYDWVGKAGHTNSYEEILEVICAKPPNPIWVACLYSWLELVEYFFAVGFEGRDQQRRLNSHSTYNIDTPLTYAVSTGHVKLTECLAQCYKNATTALGKKPSQSTGSNLDPLVRAVNQNELRLVKLMLDHGGIDSQNQAFLTAARKQLCEVMQFLIDETPSMGAVGYEALVACCKNGYHESFELLISNGCKTEPSNNLLYYATSTNQAGIVERLLQNGLAMGGMSTALRMAEADGYDAIASNLLNHGATKDSFAVIREILHECPQSALRLIVADYDVQNMFHTKRRTAMHYAAEKGYRKVVAGLLEKGASVDPYDNDRCTPLHLATRKGHFACVQVLLEHGADVLAINRDGHYPLDIAEDYNQHAVEALLRQTMQRLLDQLQSLRDTDNEGSSSGITKQAVDETSERQVPDIEVPSIMVSGVETSLVGCQSG